LQNSQSLNPKVKYYKLCKKIIIIHKIYLGLIHLQYGYN